MFECKVVEDGYEGTGTLDALNDVAPSSWRCQHAVV